MPALALLVCSFAECLAQQTATPSTTLAESLSEEVNDPTATLTRAQIQEFFTPSQYGTNAQPNTLQGRFILAILPHELLPVCGELLILPEPSIFATAASIPPLGLTHPVCGQYLRFAFWKSVQPTACFVRLASKGPEPA